MRKAHSTQHTAHSTQHTIFKRLLVFVMSISLFILSSCEKELYEENLKSNNQNIELKHISISDVKKNKVVYDKLTKPSARFIASNSNKKITDSINNFSIDSEEGVYIQSGDYESYTFEVIRDNGSIYNLENVVVSKLPNNTYQTILIQYNLTDEELDAYRNGEYINFIGRTNKIVLEDSVVSEQIAGKYLLNGRCYEDVQQFVQGHNCTEGGDHKFGDNKCVGFGGPTGATISHYVTVSIQVPCDEGGGGGGGVPTPVPTTNPSNGFFGGTGGTRGQIITTPTTMTAAQKKVKSFKMQLSSGQNQCFNNLPPTVRAELDNYVAYTLMALEDGTVVPTNGEDPIHNEAEEMMAQMCANSGVFNSITPLLIEKKIDDTLLDPCSKGVYQQIKNTTNCDFANVLAKLNANDKIYKTTIKTEHNNYTDSNGNVVQVTAPANTVRTTQGVKFDYTIYINPDYPGKTKLFIAALLLHEVAHAYFFSVADDYNTGVTNSFNELPILFNAAVVNHFPIGPDLHHEEIANSYVNAIASALQEFQPGLPMQIYEDLAWAGLNGTPIFDVKFPVGNPNRQRILNRGACEQNGTPIGQGTPNQQNPMGQPCN